MLIIEINECFFSCGLVELTYIFWGAGGVVRGHKEQSCCRLLCACEQSRLALFAVSCLLKQIADTKALLPCRGTITIVFFIFIFY